jgi:hypothetical protein
MLSNWNLGWFAKKRKEAMDSDDGLGRWRVRLSCGLNWIGLCIWRLHSESESMFCYSGVLRLR